MPPFLTPLLVSLALALLSFVLAYPVRVGGFRVDALGLFLVLIALVNLRGAFRFAVPPRREDGAPPAQPPAPWWFWVTALVTVGLVTAGVLRALRYTG